MSHYATLDEVKSAIGVDDMLDDSELQVALDSAEDLIDRHCRRTFGAASSGTRVYDGHQVLRIDDATTVSKIETRPSRTGAWVEVSADDYELRPLNASDDGRPYTDLLIFHPHAIHRVRVEGEFGWPEVPGAVKQATILQASRLARRREAPLGISQVPGFDGTTGMRVLARLDADVEVLLAGYRRDPVLVG